MLEPAQEAAKIWEGKNVAEMSNSEKSVVKTANFILAFYNFNKDGDNNCDAAQPFIEKVAAIDPNDSSIKQLVEYCEALQSQGKK